jgi:hypothetical protein
VSGIGQSAATERNWNKEEHAQMVWQSGAGHSQEYKSQCVHSWEVKWWTEAKRSGRQRTSKCVVALCVWPCHRGMGLIWGTMGTRFFPPPKAEIGCLRCWNSEVPVAEELWHQCAQCCTLDSKLFSLGISKLEEWCIWIENSKIFVNL